MSSHPPPTQIHFHYSISNFIWKSLCQTECSLLRASYESPLQVGSSVADCASLVWLCRTDRRTDGRTVLKTDALYFGGKSDNLIAGRAFSCHLLLVGPPISISSHLSGKLSRFRFGANKKLETRKTRELNECVGGR